jgi:hypothetical protein
VRILIHPRSLSTEKELRDRASKALETALAPVQRFLLWVDVYLTDVNGPRGGPDKRCRVVAHLRSGPVVVSRTGPDPVATVAAAAAHCRQLVLNRLKRARGRRPRLVAV